MTNRQYLLALDSGSQSSRALLFDRTGRILAAAQQQHAPMKYPEPGAVEQDPHDIRDALFQSIRQCLERWGGDEREIAATALTTQRNTVVPVAADGSPLADATSWLDRRTAGVDSEPSRPLRVLLKALGPHALLPRLLAKSWPRQWREWRPQLLEQMHWLASIEAWLNHQLTGRMAVAPGGLAGAWPLDVPARRWSDSKLLFKLLAYERRWLPEIVEPGCLIGGVTAEAAERTGLPAGLPVYACGGDKQAEALGAGVTAGNGRVAAVSLGTGSSICIPLTRPVQSRKYLWVTMAGAEPGCFCHEYLLFRGMWTVRWFGLQFARELEAVARESGTSVEALLCDEAAAVPAGCDGIVVWPRWSPTLTHPLETGSVVGLKETHGRGHFFRALLEGIAFDLRRGLGILEKALHTKVERLHVGGGGARSNLVVEILADVLGLPVVRPISQELAARGAAMVAALGDRQFANAKAAVAAMVPEAPTIVPDPRHVELYDRIYREVYLPGLKSCHTLSRASFLARMREQ